MKKPGLIMFDYDGVIVDSFEIHAKCFILACRDNGYLGISTREELLNLYEGNVYNGLLERGLTVNLIDKILADYGIMQKEYLHQIHLFAGMKECIEKLGIINKIYIITSNISEAAVQVLNSKGIKSYQEVLGADKEKSKVKKIKNLTRTYANVDAYFIGDTKGDIYEGKEAGVKTIGTAWGWHGKDRLAEAAPDYIVHSPEGLVSLFHKLACKSQ
ncbi:MAG: HAD family hydrolase [Clostridia bacterium]|nr:HAD family hydrolase [Clostridia bacterium]